MAIYGTLATDNILSIDASIADNAVDIFVYDTRKDSDGGAWRKRCQHTSWYNETLNTATRGSRREFPAVAVIVAQSDRVTIYDGDDPDMPMWMILNKGSSGSLIYSASTDVLTSITAGNGNIYYGMNVSGGFSTIEFINDSAFKYRPSNRTNRGRFNGSISDRDLTLGWNFETITLADENVNDVAMTVLPNAPIDETTGLPIPTIAVATNGGVSVIRDDGQVFDLTFSSQNGNKVFKVTFDDNYQICMLLGYSNVYPYTSYIYHVPSSDTALSSVTDRVLNNSTYNFPSDAYGAANTSSGDINAYIDSKYFGTDKGMSFLTPNKNDIGGQLICHINTEFNSGWQHGNVKGAFLADTTVESLTANTNLATNATQFDTDRLTSETYDDGDTSWQMVDNAGTANGYLALRLNGLTVGQSYIISMTWDNNATLDATYNHRIDHNSGGSTNFTHWNKTNASSETLTGVFTATSQNGEELVFYANAITLNVSNFIVRAVDDEDRSVNAKGLQVFGTITKTPVATGAELVAYGGFSSNNYLEQPHHSGLEVGTGDFYVMGWFRGTDSTYNSPFEISGPPDSDNTGDGSILLLAGPVYPGLRFYTRNNVSGGWNFNNNGVPFINDNLTWNFVCCLRRSGVKYIFMNGQDGVNAGVHADNLTEPDSIMRLGKRSDGAGAAWLGSLALWRFGQGAPSDEQIRKIYEDEKVLFQENAACTLYGSSDAVTALAYDDTTSLLHVGTASGRSEFKGLRRVGNTTTAVTTAISASNGLVAEQ